MLRSLAGTPPARSGDIAIVQEHYTTLKPLTIKSDGHFHNRYGRFMHHSVVDHPLGRRIASASPSHPKSNGTGSGAGFVHVLAPTPELWAGAMRHRTQIVYPPDAAIIALLLELRPGCMIVECGTGSGSASTVFARAVAPSGTVRSFDFHAERAAAAEKDMRTLGLDSVVHISGGVDVVRHGFVGVKDASADAVFLDIPVPYAMGKEINRVLKKDAPVCIFSPCIEQVQKSCTMLRELGFHSLRTVTAPVRTYETREMRLATPGFDDLEQHRSANTSDNEPDQESDPPPKPPLKRRRPDTDDALTSDTATTTVPAADPSLPLTDKRVKGRNRTAGAERLAVATKNGQNKHVGRVLRPSVRLHSKPFPVMKGHTSYLTFAKKSPDFAPADPTPANANENENENSITNGNGNDNDNKDKNINGIGNDKDDARSTATGDCVVQ